jgi:hypothetical protein
MKKVISMGSLFVKMTRSCRRYGLFLGPLAPVGDGTGDQDLPVGQRVDLGSGRSADCFPLCLADRAFLRPVSAHSLGPAFAALLVAQPFRAG